MRTLVSLMLVKKGSVGFDFTHIHWGWVVLVTLVLFAVMAIRKKKNFTEATLWMLGVIFVFAIFPWALGLAS